MKGTDYCREGILQNKKESFYNRRVYIFGAGKIGADFLRITNHYNIIEGFVDNDKMKQENGHMGLQVLSFDEYVNICKQNEAILVLCCSERNTIPITKQFDSAGLICGLDYFIYDDFRSHILPAFIFEKKNEVFVELCQISVTERCTLRCKNCAHGCYNVAMKKRDLTLDEAMLSADNFFKYVDYVDEFVVIGGEPLLYRYTAELIEYIGKKYRQKMNIFSVTTNGSIIPNAKVLNAAKEYNLLFRISNYSKSVPKLKSKYKELEKLLSATAVDYLIGDYESEWVDYGFGHFDRKLLNNDVAKDRKAEMELIGVFDSCKTPCREVRGDKYYYCVQARSCSENLGIGNGLEDCFILHDKAEEQDLRKRFVSYECGISSKGYLSMCNYCYGNEKYKYPVPAAEQVDER